MDHRIIRFEAPVRYAVVAEHYLAPRPPRALLVCWTVYDRPRDIPDSFVVRRSFVGAEGQVGIEPVALAFPDLEAARSCISPAAYNVGRQTEDDPAIAEVWIE